MDEGGHRVGHGQRVGRAVKVVKRAGYTLARLRFGLQSGYNIISNCCRKRERGLHLSDGPHGGEAVDEEGSKRPVKKQRHHVNIQAFTPSVIPVQPASVQPASGPSPSLLAAPSAAVGTDPNHTHAQDARRVMLARKQNVNGYTVGQRRQIVKQRLQNVFAKQAAAGLSHQSAMETAAIHLPGFNFGRNPRPGPISTAERSVGGGPVERVAARSAVLVSLASGAEKAQRGASGLAHAHGAISRRESVPLMQRLADKMAHAPPMGGRLMSTVPAFYKGSQGLKEDVLCDPQLPGHSPGAVTQSLDQAISQQTVANVERVDVVSEAAVKSASILTLASNKLRPKLSL